MRAPPHLDRATRRWWKATAERHDLSDDGLRLLTLAAEAWDRREQARTEIAEHGLTYEDRFGAPRTRPEVAIERDARLAYARIIRQLGLDVEDPGGGNPDDPFAGVLE
jgi:P27 family predicted phage terminase small subunit